MINIQNISVVEGRSPDFNITRVISKAWFGVWDTDIIPQPVLSFSHYIEVTSQT